MHRRIILGISAVTAMGLALLAGNGIAQPKTLKEQITGAWILDSVYDQSQDGKKHEPWGPNVKGTVIFTATGRFSLQIISADRSKTASNNPRTPVGQSVGYFGSYTVAEATKTITYNIERSSFPQWDGIERRSVVAEVTAGDMHLVQGAIQDPTLGTIEPHLTFKRVN